MPIAGRPLLDYWVAQLKQAQIETALINTHHLAEQVRAYIAQINAQSPFQLAETYEPQLLGSAGTLAANPDFANDAEQIVIIYTDNFSNVDLRAFLTFHEQHPDPITMLLFHAPNPKACGIAELDVQQRIIGFEEKPQQPVSDLANAGVYVFDTAIYQRVSAMRAFDLGFDVLPQFIGKMRGWVWEGYHRDMGTYKTYLQAQRDAVELMGHFNQGKPAVFLDRDGTLIEHVHYLSRPDQVKLVPGAAEAIKQLKTAGFACILVTNQAAIGLGMLTEQGLQEIHQVLIEQLANQGAQLDGIYYCPIASQVKDRITVEQYDRKPGPGLLFKAAKELQLNLTRSWMIGDMVSDILAGYHAHCAGLILIAGEKSAEIPPTIQYQNVTDLSTAVKSILTIKP